MRVGLIGYGAWGRWHATSLAGLPGVTLAAILAHGDASAAAASVDHPGVPVVRSMEALLGMGLDAVDIVSPNHLHAEQCLAALEAGLHVLIEKPLATTEADCARIEAAARRAGRVVAAGHELRVSTQWGMIEREIAAGAIGMPMAATYSLFRRPFRPGASGWRVDAPRVGSWILEEPVHFFDLLLWYFAGHGAPRDVRATASGGTGGLQSNLTATVTYASGAFFTVTQLLSGFEHHCALDVGGTDGAIRAWWSGADARITEPVAGLSIRRAGSETPERHAFPSSGELFELKENLRQSLAAIAAGGVPPTPLADAARAVRVCLAVEEACRTGGVVGLGVG